MSLFVPAHSVSLCLFVLFRCGFQSIFANNSAHCRRFKVHDDVSLCLFVFFVIFSLCFVSLLFLVDLCQQLHPLSTCPRFKVHNDYQRNFARKFASKTTHCPRFKVHDGYRRKFDVNIILHSVFQRKQLYHNQVIRGVDTMN